MCGNRGKSKMVTLNIVSVIVCSEGASLKAKVVMVSSRNAMVEMSVSHTLFL